MSKKVKIAIVLSVLSIIPMVLALMASHTVGNLAYILTPITGPFLLVISFIFYILDNTTNSQNYELMNNLTKSTFFFFSSFFIIQFLYFYALIKIYYKIKNKFKTNKSPLVSNNKYLFFYLIYYILVLIFLVFISSRFLSHN